MKCRRMIAVATVWCVGRWAKYDINHKVYLGRGLRDGNLGDGILERGERNVRYRLMPNEAMAPANLAAKLICFLAAPSIRTIHPAFHASRYGLELSKIVRGRPLREVQLRKGYDFPRRRKSEEPWPLEDE